ncbi:MAG: hypothetical protein IJ909_08170 [Fibrobacter sp.]|nr:hypothetical protein [Fibrobacter sp.]
MQRFLVYTVAIAILILIGYDTFAILTGTATASTIAEAAVGWGVILALSVVAFIKTVSNSTWTGSKARSPQAPHSFPDEIKTFIASKFDSLYSRISVCITTAERAIDRIERMGSKVDSAMEQLHGLEETTEGISSTVFDMKSTVESFVADPKPDAFVTTINTMDDNGKLVKLYDLEPEDTYELALEKARESLEARKEEGNPVENARITVLPVFY